MSATGTPDRVTGRLPLAAAVTLALVAVLLATAAPHRAGAAPNPTGGHPIAYTYDQTPGLTSTVYAIDTVTDQLKAQIPLTQEAESIAITPDASLVLVGEGAPGVGAAARPAVLAPRQLATGGQLQAISTATNKIVATTQVGGAPQAIAIDPKGQTAYVGNGQFLSNPPSISPVTIGPGPALNAQQPITVPPASDFTPAPMNLAVTPDGSSLLVITNDSNLDALSLPGGALQSRAGIAPADSGHPPSIVVDPDGSTAYITVSPPVSSGPSTIEPVKLGSTLQAGTPFTMPTSTDVSDLALATTSSGKKTLYFGDTNNANRVGAIPLGSANPAVSTIGFPASQFGGAPQGLFATPDGSTVEVTTAYQGTAPGATVALTGADSPPGTLSNCVPGQTCPPGMGKIAVTPDQAPVADFTPTAGPPNSPSLFDASASTVAYGTITTYAWDFGDGSTQKTTSPTVTHKYAKAGTYTVSLVETDSAGTSVGTSPNSTIFTGKTMSRNGGPSAQKRHQIDISNSATPIPSSSLNPTPTSSASPVPGFSPKITLTPDVGPPGTVVAVDGTGFPPNKAVVLFWTPGIGRTPVTADAKGTFSGRQVLIFPKDQLGRRTLTADSFPTATATFLVVPPPLAPGGAEQILPQLVYRG